jgi:hypothetical protein
LVFEEGKVREHFLPTSLDFCQRSGAKLVPCSRDVDRCRFSAGYSGRRVGRGAVAKTSMVLSQERTNDDCHPGEALGETLRGAPLVALATNEFSFDEEWSQMIRMSQTLGRTPDRKAVALVTTGELRWVGA